MGLPSPGCRSSTSSRPRSTSGSSPRCRVWSPRKWRSSWRATSWRSKARRSRWPRRRR